ncbi:MAG TPA: CotH kinase family protein [Oligoflexus sp.]|uniref:CotH kinase family protein n=1 Tax=Oligoflexus sp. TaxID=1971216 RepID=UPI002D7F72E4|nr:CotH kinase family protein [Oligoflexus sp.]HET9240196.1 CotH kinase family protein [Oligoflexus sp.]
MLFLLRSPLSIVIALLAFQAACSRPYESRRHSPKPNLPIPTKVNEDQKQTADVSQLLTINGDGPHYEYSDPCELALRNTLRTIVIQTPAGAEIPPDQELRGTLSMYERGQPGQSNPGLVTDILIKLRGNSSRSFPKKQFAVESIGGNGKGIELPLLDPSCPAGQKWVLNGQYADKTLMRNYTALNLARRLNVYAPRSAFVSLYFMVDGKPTFHGLYVLTERIEVSKERVNLQKPTAEDPSGGYLLRMDRVDPEKLALDGATEVGLMVDNVKKDKLSPAQTSYIQEYHDRIREVLGQSMVVPEDSPLHHTHWIDTASFQSYLLLRELFRDVDTYYLSTYLTKDRGPNAKLKMGPVWDFDLAFGNANYGYNGATEGWQFDFADSQIALWMRNLMRDPKYAEQTRSRWKGMREGPFSDHNLSSFIHETLQHIAPEARENFVRWPILNELVWPNRQALGSHLAEVQDLHDWLIKRARWMDEALR